MARRSPVLDAQSALAFLAQASGILAGSLDYERTLSEVAQLAVPDVADWCAVDIVEPGPRQITSGHPDPEQEALLLELRRRFRAEKQGSEGTARVIATGEPELATDVTGRAEIALRDDEDELYRRLAPRSYMIVPLVARGRTLGALTLLSTRSGRHYVASDLDFAQQLARRFAIAVDNARLYEEAERSRSLLDTLFASAAVGLGFYDTAMRCVRVNDALAHISGRPTEAHVGCGVEEMLGPEGPRLAQMCRQVIETGIAQTDQDFSGQVATSGGRIRHWIVSMTPVRALESGVLGVGVVVVEATERRELLHRERQGRERATFLARAGEILESSLDYQTTLANVARIAVPTIADWCAIHMIGDQGIIELVAVAHTDPGKEALAWDLERRFPTSAGRSSGPAGVIRTGRSEIMSEITAERLEARIDDPTRLEILRGLGLHASITAPLRARGRTLGSIVFVSAESERSFDSDDVALAEELARRAGLAVDNARLYTERSHIAHALQAELLPARLPVVPGVEVAVRYRAAGELIEVGGDFYDVFETRAGDWAFVIGDVSGKGAEAAAVTALARHTLRTASLQPSSPSELLGILNEALLAQRAGSEFCTVCLAHLRQDRSGITLRVALGGHPPAMILASDGSVRSCGTAGTLLGIFPDPDLPEQVEQLRPGDTVLLYTDGVTEAGFAHEEIGDGGLRRLLETLGGIEPDGIVSAVERLAVTAGAGEQRDDIALVAFRVGTADGAPAIALEPCCPGRHGDHGCV
ncbi:MAG: hypothetical protein NVSMB25_00140 [Thermoleophilaceae bacterium]